MLGRLAEIMAILTLAPFLGALSVSSPVTMSFQVELVHRLLDIQRRKYTLWPSPMSPTDSAPSYANLLENAFATCGPWHLKDSDGCKLHSQTSLVRVLTLTHWSLEIHHKFLIPSEKCATQCLPLSALVPVASVPGGLKVFGNTLPEPQIHRHSSVVKPWTCHALCSRCQHKREDQSSMPTSPHIESPTSYRPLSTAPGSVPLKTLSRTQRKGMCPCRISTAPKCNHAFFCRMNDWVRHCCRHKDS